MSLVSRYLDPALVERLNHLALSGRRVVEGSTIGQHRSPVKGASVEFRQHRFYVAGDEPKRLDWRVLGRTDRLYVKEYDEETNLRCMVLLDASGSMRYGGRGGAKFDYAGRLVASLAYLMLNQTEAVGIALCGQKLAGWLPAHGGSGQLPRLIDVLEKVTPAGPANLPACVHEAAERLGKRSLVIVVSDFFSPVATIREAMAHLTHDRHEVLALQVLDPDELTFPFKTWTKFNGLEGERAEYAEPAMVRQTYLENFRRHSAELDNSCRQLGIEFHRFVTDRPLIESLTLFLERRARR